LITAEGSATLRMVLKFFRESYERWILIWTTSPKGFCHERITLPDLLFTESFGRLSWANTGQLMEATKRRSTKLFTMILGNVSGTQLLLLMQI
jgi:hypothetical protein